MTISPTPQQPITAEPPSRRQLLFTFSVEVLFYALLTFVFFYAADLLWDFRVEKSFLVGMIYFVFDIFLLYMHEGGHFLFMFFGDTLSILGGSFWEVMLPFLVFVFALRDRSRIAPFPLYYAGLGLMRVSLYVRDAPYRKLPLLGGDKNRHDWWNLLRKWDMLYDAETIADIMYIIAILMCVGALLAGFYIAAMAYFRPKVVVHHSVERSLDQLIAKNRTQVLKRE
jgi:hypothetical protein